MDCWHGSHLLHTCPDTGTSTVYTLTLELLTFGFVTFMEKTEADRAHHASTSRGGAKHLA